MISSVFKSSGHSLLMRVMAQHDQDNVVSNIRLSLFASQGCLLCKASFDTSNMQSAEVS